MRDDRVELEAAAAQRQERLQAGADARRERIVRAASEFNRADQAWRRANTREMSLRADGAPADAVSVAKTRVQALARERQAAIAAVVEARLSRAARHQAGLDRVGDETLRAELAELDAGLQSKGRAS